MSGLGLRAATVLASVSCALALSLATTPASVAAQAESPGAGAAQDVERLIEEGVRLREAGDDDAAVAIFRRAVALDATPRVQAQLGLALLATGAFVESYEILEGTLATRDPWIETHRDALRASFDSASQHVGLIEITGGAPGAHVSVNARSAGDLPLARPIRAATGRAMVDISLEGYRTFSAEVLVQPGRTSRVRAELLRPAPDLAAASPSGDDWVLPVILVGVALVVGGVVTGLAIGLQQPSYQTPDVGGVVVTLGGTF